MVRSSYFFFIVYRKREENARKRASRSCDSLFAFLAFADDVQELAVLGHSLNQILLERHKEILLVWNKIRLQIADDVQHLADGSHGLGQVLHHNVLHSIYPPIIE